jgi:hypothetical protein
MRYSVVDEQGDTGMPPSLPPSPGWGEAWGKSRYSLDVSRRRTVGPQRTEVPYSLAKDDALDTYPSGPTT